MLLYSKLFRSENAIYFRGTHRMLSYLIFNTKQALYQTFKIALIFAHKSIIYRAMFNLVIDKGDIICGFRRIQYLIVQISWGFSLYEM